MEWKHVDAWVQKVAVWVKSLGFLDASLLPPGLARDLPELMNTTPEVLTWLEQRYLWHGILNDLSHLQIGAANRRWYFWFHLAQAVRQLTCSEDVQVFVRRAGSSRFVRLEPLGEEEREDGAAGPPSELLSEREANSSASHSPQPGGAPAQNESVTLELISGEALQFQLSSASPFPRIRRERMVLEESERRQLSALVAPQLPAQVRGKSVSLENANRAAENPEGILGWDPGFLAALDACRRVAASDASVYLFGESGTGKELFARHLHRCSSRRSGGFIAINCSAIPSELIESEMFGHEKGAFTGAYFRKIGRVEQAHGGTLFLDEIGEMPLAFQAKLLRYLQEKTFNRVGGTQSVHSDARIVVATHRDLKEMVENGQFREDLYYRVHVVPIAIPPLRVRGGDLRRMAAHFFERFIGKSRSSRRTVDPLVYEALERYSWPGNVRELENVIQRTVIMASGEVLEMKDLPPEIRQATLSFKTPSFSLHPFERFDHVIPHDREQLNQLKREVELISQSYERDLERRFLMQLLEASGNSPRRAAELAGINRTLFYKLLKRAGVDVGVLAREDA
jgi:DNA-binding NtrC family response regulator